MTNTFTHFTWGGFKFGNQHYYGFPKGKRGWIVEKLVLDGSSSAIWGDDRYKYIHTIKDEIDYDDFMLMIKYCYEHEGRCPITMPEDYETMSIVEFMVTVLDEMIAHELSILEELNDIRTRCRNSS